MILPIEKQVCSLELAKRLKELGVPQESAFVWAVHFDQIELIQDDGTLDDADNWEYFAAFSVAELGEMLAEELSWRNIKYYLQLEKKRCFYYHPSDHVQGVLCQPFIADNEADARAKALIWLIENNLVSPAPAAGSPKIQANHAR